MVTEITSVVAQRPDLRITLTAKGTFLGNRNVLYLLVVVV